ncbi:hypothetical protein LSPH24S_08750 [Lysinibacillus sphaericus]
MLRSPSRTVFYKRTSVWNEELNKLVLEFQPNKIVLPILPLKIEVEQLYGISQVKFYTGRLTMHWKQLLEKNDTNCYLQQESFIWQNARLTAEGFIATFYGLEEKMYLRTKLYDRRLWSHRQNARFFTRKDGR